MNSHKRTASYSELRFLAKQEGLGWFSSRFWALIGVLGGTQFVTLSGVDNDKASATLHPVEAKKEIEMNKPHKHAEPLRKMCVLAANKKAIEDAPTFALIDWGGATITLICLGQYSPPWAINFAAWYALRHIKRSKP